MDKITFEEICELEPSIERAYRLAKMIGRRRGQYFCANAIWYEFFRPIVTHVIGFNRKPSEQLNSPVPYVPTWDNEPEHRVYPDIRFGTSSSRDPRLETEYAYDIAYQTIYEALPDCNHEWGACW